MHANVQKCMKTYKNVYQCIKSSDLRPIERRRTTLNTPPGPIAPDGRPPQGGHAHGTPERPPSVPAVNDI